MLRYKIGRDNTAAMGAYNSYRVATDMSIMSCCLLRLIGQMQGIMFVEKTSFLFKRQPGAARSKTTPPRRILQGATEPCVQRAEILSVTRIC